MAKNYFHFVTAFCVSSLTASAQEWNLSVARPAIPTIINVPAKSIIEFASVRSNLTQTSSTATLDYGNGAVISSAFTSVSFPAVTDRFVGPLTITIALTGPPTSFYAVPYRITNSTAVSSTPSNSVVIPANATGNVQIILESSIDMVTWNSATPGSYNASTTNRFFRVRAVQQ